MYKGNRLWKKEGKKQTNKQKKSKQIEKCPNHSDSDQQTNKKEKSQVSRSTVTSVKAENFSKISSHLTQKV